MSVKKYFKFDEINQFLEDETDINYYATNQVRRVAVGNMLGDYNEQGIYVLDEKLIKELVDMPKIIVDSVGGADLIRSAIKFDGYVHFMLTIEEDKASLILLEKINFESNVKYNAGSYTNMNEYVLEDIKIPDRDVDKNVIYAKFNVKREDEGRYYEYTDLTDEELSHFTNVLNKLKYNLLVQNVMLKKEKEIETIEADYFDNVLKAFSEYEEIKKQFEKILKELIVSKQNFLMINKPFFAKTINELLDNCLLVFLSKLPPEIRLKIEEKIRKAKDKYYKAYNNIVHMQFLANQSAVVQESDTMIGELTNNIIETESKVTRYEIDDVELEKTFYAILEENSKLKEEKLKENSGAEVIRFDNPILSKFFEEIKKEFGVDMLKNKEAVINKVEQMAKKEIETKKPENKEVKKPEQKKEEVKKPEVKQEKKPEAKKEVKSASKPAASKPSAPKSATKKSGAEKAVPATKGATPTVASSGNGSIIKKVTGTLETTFDYKPAQVIENKTVKPITDNHSISDDLQLY